MVRTFNDALRSLIARFKGVRITKLEVVSRDLEKRSESEQQTIFYAKTTTDGGSPTFCKAQSSQPDSPLYISDHKAVSFS